MEKRLSALIAAMIVSSALLAACGSDDGDGSATDERAPAAVKAELLACLERVKIRVVPSGKVDITVQDRVPRVPVPAEYLGAAVLPTTGFYDLWLAGDPDTALAAAEVLNEALAQKPGPQGKLAGTRGQVVIAVGGNVQIDNPEEILDLLRCARSL